MQMLLLLAEDEDSKRERLKAFLSDALAGWSVQETKSVRSTIDALRQQTPSILILDMSLPTFDIAAGEPGGRPQGFGGIEVVRYLERDGLAVPIIVVTQHPAIPKDGQMIPLAGIEQMVMEESPSNFKGLVYYNTLTGGWKGELLSLLTAIQDERSDQV